MCSGGKRDGRVAIAQVAANSTYRPSYRNLLLFTGLRFQPPTLTRPAVLHPDALSSVPRALTGLVYKNRSLLSARKFVQRYFLSREVDLRNMIKFRDPRMALMDTVRKFGREPPKSRYAILLLYLPSAMRYTSAEPEPTLPVGCSRRRVGTRTLLYSSSASTRAPTNWARDSVAR